MSVESETDFGQFSPLFAGFAQSPHLASCPARHVDDEAREAPSSRAGEEEAQPMLARFEKTKEEKKK